MQEQATSSIAASSIPSSSERSSSSALHLEVKEGSILPLLFSLFFIQNSIFSLFLKFLAGKELKFGIPEVGFARNV